ncbi:uncharacterized protein DUF4145 [Gibbsiella quercinecans]|uniref:DUF4145 domain-containing protein n=1 Tax=Gibbsiella quercinecans TaxID=929813 RepID=A0A250B140_9GAMM|nr:DUF4145 domain-containing protein [Gibbsiella quercinecans]ATA19973.1 hypothetical protein AWC35_11870 [Gibbsiella quercinecans]RLM05049.1 DUF4145 domain-containing protein [Gibbsiella quercinecans]RLM05228.1 DUF4145 domain-containing protein [Gibbsiella quercinecans]TCT82684.1 uncharacterized protein DUF4145 [Gibbsiella quercinecans]
MTNKVQQRFNDLKEFSDRVSSSSHTVHSQYTGSDTYVDSELLLQWLTKTENLIVSVCGENSTYFEAFTEAKKISSFETNQSVFNRLKSIFTAIKEDYENGYLVSYKSLIQADLFDSELEQAKELLTSGYTTAAAVIAGTVLETSLRELCERSSIPKGKMDKMNADLAKHGVYNSIQQKAITAMAGIRNSAAHGKVDEFIKDDVTNMISNIESFLIKHLN